MEGFEAREYVMRQFRPTCIAFASQKAALMCKENNLSPAEFLRPFMDLRKEQLIISPPNKAPSYVLKDFRIDVYDAGDYEKMPASAHLRVRRQVLESSPPYFSFNDPAAVDVRDLQERRTSWFELWRNTFLELHRCQTIEMLQQPFAMFTLVTSFEDIQSALHFTLGKKPEIVTNYYELDIPKILFILTPNQPESVAKAGEICEVLKKQITTFKIFVLPMNSLQPTGQKYLNDIWVPYIKVFKQEGEFESFNSSERGMLLAKAERIKIQEVIVEAIRGVILPQVERKYSALFIQVNPSRGWGAFLAGDVPAAEGKQGKADWELRYAADLAFLVQDYTNSVKLYAKLFERLRKGSLHAETGSCKETMTLATLLVEPGRKDFAKNMEVAMQYYARGNCLNLVVRNAIYCYDVLTLQKRFSDASRYLNNAYGFAEREEEIPALLLEQTAFAMVRSNPPLLRKFACMMIHAGRIYSNQGLIANSIYCLGISYHIYEKPNWPEILLYLCDVLGQTLTHANELKHAFGFYKKLLDVSINYQGESKQELFLTSFLKSAEKLRNGAESGTMLVPNLKGILRMDSIIRVLPETVEIFASQDEIYCNDKARLYYEKYDMSVKKEGIIMPPEEDEQLEQVPIEKLYNKSQSWMNLGKMIDGDMADPIEDSENAKQKARAETLRDLWFYDEKMTKRKSLLYTRKRRFVYAMEPIYIKFRCRNLLNTHLHLSDLRCVCHYAGSESVAALEVASLPITFSPKELKEIILSILPKEEGEVSVEGLQWTVSGLVQGGYEFAQITGRQEPQVLAVRQRAGNLAVSTDRHFKKLYLDGEIDKYTLKLKNVGMMPVSRITLQTDYPLLLGWRSKSLDWVINPQEERELVVYLRAGMINAQVKQDSLMPRVLIRYDCVSREELQLFRYKRLEHSIAVDPSFAIKDNCMRSFKSLNEYLLNVQIEKMYAKNEAFSLDELCVVDESWSIVEKQQFTGFDKVFNIFISLVYECADNAEESSVEPKSKSIRLGRHKADEGADKAEQILETTRVEPYASYLAEYKDFQQSRRKLESLTENSVDVLATWTLEHERNIVHGAHIVPVTFSSYNSTVALKKGPSKLDLFPLQIVHECPYYVHHDFGAEPVCTVPLKLRIKNSSYHTARFRFEALKMQRDSKEKSNNFMWQGPSTRNIVALEPNRQAELYLEATCIEHGVYDLNRFSFAFFRNPETGEDLDPSGIMPKNVSLKVYSLERDQIFVTILPP